MPYYVGVKGKLCLAKILIRERLKTKLAHAYMNGNWELGPVQSIKILSQPFFLGLNHFRYIFLLAFVQWATALSSLKPALSTQSEAISYLFFFPVALFNLFRIILCIENFWRISADVEQK